MSTTPKKVAILGGGVGALSTAIGITNDPDWRKKFSSVTVYQMGWRLGGKGASGRGEFGRIEEHGLHVWMGFYENAFRVIREVYAENGRKPGTPLADWSDAFKRHDYVLLGEQWKGSWRTWPLDFTPNDETPGAGLGIPSMWRHLVRVLGMLIMVISSAENFDPHGGKRSALHKFLDWVVAFFFLLAAVFMELGGMLLHFFRKLFGGGKDAKGKARPQPHYGVHFMVRRVKSWNEGRHGAYLDNDLARHLYVLVDFSLACMKGVAGSGILSGVIDFDELDEHDAVVWLRSHGANEVTCNSGLIHGMYDLMFAYDNGDTTKPSFGAGSFLHFAIRMCLTYRGSVFWKMQAGMGDTIFGPIYQVLKKRGVEFKFFHSVDQLHVSSDGSNIESINISIQATAKSGAYDPLVDVNGLPCWPADPHYDQLVEGEALKKEQVNLESFWTTWKPVGSKMLQRGVDFDIVVLGIPVAAHQFICKELIDRNALWKNMTDNVQTTRTLAMQLWLQPDLKGLGWNEPSPIIDSYAQPFNTWADMSQLIVREQWPPTLPVKNISYFCGTMTGGIPAKSDIDAPRRELLAVKELALDWLRKNPGFLWPNATQANGSLDWSVLTDPTNASGEARFEAQFWRVNIDPTERYTLTLPKTTQHRMRADNTGFANLIVAGDWTWQPMNVGCVEGTVMSGLMAANVMLGQPIDKGIIGYRRS
jgi:uncharacterized protein with NAD-binding domain and iron-sulfur cluster